MVIVKNRTLQFSNREQYLGTEYDESSSVRIFSVPRLGIDGVDIAGLTFVMNIIRPDGKNLSAYLEKEVRENEVLLTWKIENPVLNVPGTLFINIRSTDSQGTVRWSSYPAAVYSGDSIGSPDGSEEAVMGFEQLVAKVESLYLEMGYGEEARAEAEAARQQAEAERAEAEKKREANANAVIQTFEAAIKSAEDHAEKSEQYSEIARNEADRASMYANLIEPDFILQDNRIYINQTSTVEFLVIDNRLCFKLPA